MKVYTLAEWRDAVESCKSYDEATNLKIVLDCMAEHYDPIIVEYIHAKVGEREKQFA